jgi:glycosyltransferase involved in cell wall biosynthesis
MRVLVVNPGSDVYGSDLQVLQSIHGLVAAGADVLVVAPTGGPLQTHLHAAGARAVVMPFPVIRRAYLSAAGLVRLAVDLTRAIGPMRRMMRASRADLVYVNTTTIPWWIIAARAGGIPVLCHVHEAEDADALWIRRGMAAPLLAADTVLFISRTAARAAAEVLPRLRRRSVVVLNGVPDRDLAPVPSPRGARVRLALVGRLSDRKSQHIAIAAVDVLRRRGLDVELELAGTVYPGNEGYEERLRAQVRDLGLEDRVRFSGYVTPSSAVVDRADIALSLSTRDALGNVVIEAQLAQRPVIATGVGGHLETIDHDVTGLHVPPNDADAVADAVQRLVAEPATARRLAHAGRESALTTFGVARYHAEVVALARRLIGIRAAAARPRSRRTGR